MCNNETIDHFVAYENMPLQAVPDNFATVAVIITSCVLLISFIVGTIWWKRRFKERNRRVRADGVGSDPVISIALVDKESNNVDNLIATAAGDSTLREVFDHSITSGSGSGLPFLAARTLSSEIQLLNCISNGRFSEFWKGKWQEDEVCVKIFLSREETLFNTEREINSIVMLSHQNILGYIGSDVTSANSCTQLRIFLHYHSLGSLHDFLSDPNFCSPLSDVIEILRSAVSGITHLHTEIFGTQGKPAIAHRDIKSKNILMKNPTTACIGDFGLAAAHIHSSNSLRMANPSRIGTPRYASPEVLDQSISSNIESFKKSDIYSFSLVIWEVFQRSAIVGEPEEYKAPYHEFVTPDPSTEEMRKVVSLEGRRPTIPRDWHLLPKMNPFIALMVESWSQKPESRLTALNIKKKLESLAKVFNTD